MEKLKSSKTKISLQKGFTLVELLVVVAILGVLAVGLVAAINPIDKINAANDAKVLQDFSVIARAAEAYTTTHNGLYPAALAELQSSGELKNLPSAPTNYTAYLWTQYPVTPCTGGTSCTGFTIKTTLKSTKYAGGTTPAPVVIYDSTKGTQCFQATTYANNYCP